MLTGREYHDRTSYDRRRMHPRRLDWHHQPGVYKTYPGVAALPLPAVQEDDNGSLWGAVAGRSRRETPAASPLTLQDVARILAGTCAITARRRSLGGPIHFRSVASAGALYPAELYVETYSVEDLAPGLYHFGPDRGCLTPLRPGPLGTAAAAATAAESGSRPALSFWVSGIFFRSAWKYRERAFRYVLLDAGHLLENLLLALRACGLTARLTYDFDDREVARLLGLDLEREGPLAAVVVPDPADSPLAAGEEPIPLKAPVPAANRTSDREVTYDLICRAYRSGFAVNPTGAADPKRISALGVQTTQTHEIPATGPVDGERGLYQALWHRRSRRNFTAEQMARSSFERLLDLVCRSAARDGASRTRSRSGVATGVLMNAVEGYSPGFFLLSPHERRIGRVKSGEMRAAMAAVCLDQMWLAAAAVHFLFMANLSGVDACWGPRGYRYTMLGAGRLGQRLYLGATALGLGCCAVGALYDGEARALLGLDSDSSLLYLVAVGPVRGG